MTTSKKALSLIFLLIILLACLSTFADGTIYSGVEVRTAYEWLVDAVNAEDFEDARKILAESGLKDNPLYQTKEYILYLNAITFMQEENFADAKVIFEGLSILQTPFLNSRLYAAYCSGRVSESSSDYQAAILYYQNSITYDDSAERLKKCAELYDQAKLFEVQTLYERALAQNDVTKLQQAYEGYLELGNTEFAEKCKNAIDTLNKQSSYEIALMQYREAVDAGSIPGLSAAAVAFEALGDYEDSLALVISINNQIKTLQRKLAWIKTEVDVSSVTLFWVDNGEQTSEYLVEWAPVNNKKQTNALTAQTTLTLTDLIPDTDYYIRVSVSGMSQLVMETTIKTNKAENYANEAFTVINTYAAGMRRRHMEIESMATLLKTKANALTYPENNAMLLEDADPLLQKTAYGFVVSYKQNTETVGPFTQKWVLRTKDNGVYSHTTDDLASLAVSGYEVYMLDELLSMLYIDQGIWPQDTFTLEWYIDGMLASRGSMSIVQ